MDQPIAGEAEGDDHLSLHDVLAGHSADPGQEAAKRLDWDELVSFLDALAREVLRCLLQGEDLTILVPKHKRSRSSLQGDKLRLAELVRAHLGPEILRQVQEQPHWRDSLDASRQRLACRFERQPA